MFSYEFSRWTTAAQRLTCYSEVATQNASVDCVTVLEGYLHVAAFFFCFVVVEQLRWCFFFFSPLLVLTLPF